jgi:hypothetical protein
MDTMITWPEVVGVISALLWALAIIYIMTRE